MFLFFSSSSSFLFFFFFRIIGKYLRISEAGGARCILSFISHSLLITRRFGIPWSRERRGLASCRITSQRQIATHAHTFHEAVVRPNLVSFCENFIFLGGWLFGTIDATPPAPLKPIDPKVWVTIVSRPHFSPA